jgi:hypothetical protein
MKTIPIRRTTKDLTSMAAPFLVPNGGNTVRALQAAIVDDIQKRRAAHARELIKMRTIGAGLVRGEASR